MITTNRATFALYSDSRTVAEVTALLGIVPTSAHDKGDLRHTVVPAQRIRRFDQMAWLYDVKSDDPKDETGFGSVRCLLDVFSGKADVLDALTDDCSKIIWWSGDSDSEQGGFVIPAELVAGVARLGCDLYGTTCLTEDPSEQ